MFILGLTGIVGVGCGSGIGGESARLAHDGFYEGGYYAGHWSLVEAVGGQRLGP